MTLIAFLLVILVPGVKFHALLLLILSPVVLRGWDLLRKVS
ncbi:hypothetical protein [Kribbella pittospori]|nr:hypothetical protein [Kribbella pittospori]